MQRRKEASLAALFQFPSEEDRVGVGYIEWILDNECENEEFLAEAIARRKVVKIKWPDIADLKKLGNATWTNVPAIILKTGSWSDMCVCRDNIDKYDTMTPTKKDRQLHCRRFPVNKECFTTNDNDVINKKKDAKNKKKSIRNNQVSIMAVIKSTKSVDRKEDITSPIQEPNWLEVQSNLEAKIKLLTEDKDNLQTELLDLKKENRHLHRIIDTADNYKRAFKESEELHEMIKNMKKNVKDILNYRYFSEKHDVHEKSPNGLTSMETKTTSKVTCASKNSVFLPHNDSSVILFDGLLPSVSTTNFDKTLVNTLINDDIIMDCKYLQKETSVEHKSNRFANNIEDKGLDGDRHDYNDNDTTTIKKQKIDVVPKPSKGKANLTTEKKTVFLGGFEVCPIKLQASNDSSDTCLATDVLAVLCSPKEMANSSLTGKTANVHKNIGDGTLRNKDQLDPAKVQAIYDYVKKIFPNTQKEKLKKALQGKLKYESKKMYGVAFKILKKSTTDTIDDNHSSDAEIPSTE